MLEQRPHPFTIGDTTYPAFCWVFYLSYIHPVTKAPMDYCEVFLEEPTLREQTEAEHRYFAAIAKIHKEARET